MMVIQNSTLRNVVASQTKTVKLNTLRSSSRCDIIFSITVYCLEDPGSSLKLIASN